jgi:hypothetical protein
MDTHYKSEDNKESPQMSLSDMLSDSSSVVSNQHDPSVFLQALENPDVVMGQMQLKFYKCHLISATVPQYANNPDNMIFASWSFHQQFDGLKTLDGLPGVAVKFHSFEGMEQVLVNEGKFENRHKIIVIVEFRRADLAQTWAPWMKNGSQRISHVEYKSFLYARSWETMQHCLTQKYEATVAIWRSEDDDT